MNRSSISKWVLSMLLWMWAGGVYFFLEVAWKTSQGRPESISWTMFLLAIILAVPLERFGAELPWEMPLVGQACICTVAITEFEFVAVVILNVFSFARERYGTNLPRVCVPMVLLVNRWNCHVGLDEVCGRGRREAPLYITE